jgi:magnesium chelatase family protein
VSTSAAERDRVLAARERQVARLRGTPATCNAQMDAALLRRAVDLAPSAEAPLRRAYERGELSARGRDRAVRVARTIADLDGVDRIARRHVVTALGYRHDAEPGEEAAA